MPTKRVAGAIAVMLVLIFGGFVCASVAGLSKLTDSQFNLLLVAINAALAPALGFYYMASDGATGQRRKADFIPAGGASTTTVTAPADGSGTTTITETTQEKPT